MLLRLTGEVILLARNAESKVQDDVDVGGRWGVSDSLRALVERGAEYDGVDEILRLVRREVGTVTRIRVSFSLNKMGNPTN